VGEARAREKGRKGEREKGGMYCTWSLSMFSRRSTSSVSFKLTSCTSLSLRFTYGNITISSSCSGAQSRQGQGGVMSVVGTKENQVVEARKEPS